MKELTIEQKAQAYDKALERAKEINREHSKKGFKPSDDVLYIFPVLKDSEDEDEKIRKALIDGFIVMKESKNCGNTFSNHNIPVEDILNWLEKQGKWNTDNSIWHKVKPNEYVLEKTLICKKNGEIDLVEDTILSVTDAKYALPVSSLGIPKPLEKQGEQKPIDKIQLGKKYKCIASPRYSTFMIGEIYKPEDKFLYSLMNLCYDCFEPIEDGEQKLIDKIQPKFKVGDWVICCDYEPIQIIDIKHRMYYWSNGDIRPIEMVDSNSNIHLWTIQDAKDGDVLRIRNLTFIFQEITNNNVCHKDAVVAYCSYEDNDDGFGVCGPDCITDLEIITPATKEQRNLLFKKMKEAGYEWNAENKKLKEEKVDNLHNYLYSEQIPAWSEEDEEYMKSLLHIINGTRSLRPSEVKCHKNWIKSIKDRVQPQLKQEWSEEDEKNYDILLKIICGSNKSEELVNKLFDWFKSLKDRVHPQPKQEWSEEDYNEIETIACHLDNTDNEGLAEVLRNIRDKYYHIIPQSTWKPSDEQIAAVKEAACYSSVFSEKTIDNLISLSKQLKKLREE